MAKITKTTIEKLGLGEELSDAEIRGFRVRRLPSGVITYGYRFRFGGGRYTMSIGLHGEITADQARTAAKKYAGMVALGTNPAAERDAARVKAEVDKTKTVNAVLDNYERIWLGFDADGNFTGKGEGGLAENNAKGIRSCFARFVRREIGDEIIYDLEPSDIVDMMDIIKEQAGLSASDAYMRYLRAAFNWQIEKRVDRKFISPITKGLVGQTNKRDRVLEDQEIADLWAALERIDNQVPVCFTRFVKLLLLSAQRRSEVGQWHSDQIVDGDIWEFEAEVYKGRHKHCIPISKAMRSMLVRREGYMVSNDDGEHGFSGFSKPKALLDAKITEIRKTRGAKPMKHWTFHDLRRSAATIMAMYVDESVVERVLGHALVGVKGVYNRYNYLGPKREALDALATHVFEVAQGKPSPRSLRDRAAAA